MTSPLRILADENIAGISQAFAGEVGIKFMPGRAIQQAHLKEIDALLVRSVTRVDEDLLSETAVKFVGTATIGLDHIDADYLQTSGIGFAYAPGSNAQSVVEYVLSAIAYWLQQNNRTFAGLTVGIVGVGRIGGLLQRYLEHIGVRCLLCDPPRQAQDPTLPFCTFEDLLGADVISFHVPLINRGPWPTRYLINPFLLKSLNANQLLINTARGDILDNQMALHHFQDNSNPVNLVLDVWQNEPMIDAELIQHCLLATPHIAGYAIEGKWRATSMLCQALTEFFNIPINGPYLDSHTQIVQPWLPKTDDDLVGLLQSYYPIKKDDNALRNEVENLPQSFDKLRKNYPARHEFLAPVNTSIG